MADEGDECENSTRAFLLSRMRKISRGGSEWGSEEGEKEEEGEDGEGEGDEDEDEDG